MTADVVEAEMEALPPPAAEPSLVQAPDLSAGDIPPAEAPPADPLAIARAALDRATTLPRGMRLEIDRLLAADRLLLDARGQACLPLDDALAAFAASLPRQLRLDPAALPAADHPGGEGFFTGAPDELTDEKAEAIARAQLARAGWAPTA